MSELIKKAKLAKKAAVKLQVVSTEEKNYALNKIAEQLITEQQSILAANNKDVQKALENGMSSSLIDRLTLTPERITAIANAVKQLINLHDPIGETIDNWEGANGLKLTEIRVPLGVVGMIYEARPNVTVDAACLCLKMSNAIFLRGSSSTINSNKELVGILRDSLSKTAIPVDAVQLLEDTDRQTATQFFQLNRYLDVLIPRGSQQLIDTVLKSATVPVIETGAGNCHLFIDETAERDMAIKIALNGKTQRPSVCNALETIIVHEKWFKKYGHDLIDELKGENVECRLDEAILVSYADCKRASESDWEREFLDNIVAIKIVKNVEEAIEHINKYSTKHSESIVTASDENKDLFFSMVDSSSLYWNASTRFTDGEEFGFGAEIGISTQKLHARGPMGLKALTSSKYLITGTGHVRN